MMRYFVFIFFFLTICQLQAQEKKVLFTIDNEPVYTDEFLRVYNKNLDLVKDESQKDMEEYLELFINYKLKIKQALAKGLDKKQSYLTELSGYRDQLAKNYLTDVQVSDALVKEAYERLAKEIKASHILIPVNENAAPKDTLEAYNRAIEARDKVLSGENFAVVARAYSKDPSAQTNGGNLGYFSVFRMVYPFESTAYNTKKGEVSMPVRTQFGYHVIKVEDVRNSLGEVTVAHIMLAKRQVASEENNPAEKIKEIYNKLQQGEKFELLARRFSDDRNSAINGGKLQRFGTGKISSPEFENVAFSLEKEGSVSEPFKTSFGWHIVKLIQKHPVGTFDEVRIQLEDRVKKDDRAKLIDASLVSKVKERYGVTGKTDELDYFYTIVNNKFFEKTWKSPEDPEGLGRVLVQFKDQKLYNRDFANYIFSQQYKLQSQRVPIRPLVDKLYKKYFESQLLRYYQDNLENEHEDFAAIVEEYRDGLLLFDLMQEEIWDRAKDDSIGLRRFYDQNKDKYRWKTRGDVVVASCTKEQFAKKVQALLKKGLSQEEVKEQVNDGAIVNVIFTAGMVEEGHQALPKQFTFKEGVSEIYKEDDYLIVKVNEVIPPGMKTFEETKGRVINDYQQHLESTWVEKLRKGKDIKVDKKVLKKLIRQQRKKS